tara:strand:- start:5 stop:724 length:720 start_codon:yes stop_codon:yes gene_type:complete
MVEVAEDLDVVGNVTITNTLDVTDELTINTTGHDWTFEPNTSNMIVNTTNTVGQFIVNSVLYTDDKLGYGANGGTATGLVGTDGTYLTDVTISGGLDFDVATGTITREQSVGRGDFYTNSLTTSYVVFVMSSVDFETGSVDVDDANEWIRVTEDGYYTFTVNGEMDWGTATEATIRLKDTGTGDVEYSRILRKNDEDDKSFSWSDDIFLSNTNYLQLEVKRTNSGTGGDIIGYMTLKRI